MQKCLFLDRDGIINKDIGYAYKPADIEFMPGIFELCRDFQQRGFLIIIVTNQSGIARQLYSEEDFRQLNQWFIDQFSIQHITVTDIFHCPHHPKFTGICDCRKPAPGLFLQAIKKYRIDPQFSIMVGDKDSDMQAAESAGIANRVLFNANTVKRDSPAATLQVSSLNDIIKHLPR
jgi:D-glycero-D-manno-heptose 1,7-bisphosphate phosphatase